ncbi:hypothetical protein GC173_02140 [bacterium]|nr:hypothetical protein [bacterium]
MDFRSFFNKIKDQVGQVTGAEAGEPEASPQLPSDTGSGASARPATPYPRTRPDGTGTNPAGLHQRDPASTGGRSRSEGVVQNEKDDSVYNMRSEHVSRIEAMFGEFGPAISSYMLTQSLTDGGVRRVLVKLDLQSRGRDGADLAQIENWILRHGIETFCDKVKIRLGGAAPPPPPMAPPPQKDEPRVTVRPLQPNRPGAQAPVMGTPRPGPQQPRPRPVGQENSSPANPQNSPTQKVAFAPIGLVGKDVQRVHSRPESPAPPPVSTEGLLRSIIDETGKELPEKS